MPAELAVNREAVKMLVREVGVREAARRSGLNEDTVATWSARGKWLAGASTLQAALSGTASTPERVALAAQLPVSMRPTPASTESTVSDALAAANLDNSQRGRAALLRYGARSAEHLADLDPAEAVLLAPQAASVTKVLATAGSWADQDTKPILHLHLHRSDGSQE